MIFNLDNYKHLTIIGSGIQSICYDINDNKQVMKLTFISEPDSILEYYNMCLNNNNPYFPKIYSYTVFDIKNLTKKDLQYIKNNTKVKILENTNKVVISFMEKLSILDNTKLKYDYEKIFNIKNISMDDAIIQLFRNDNVKSIWKYYFDRTIKNDDIEFLSSIENNIKEKRFKKYLINIKPLLQKYNHDIKYSNMMVRDNKQLVFTDPVINLENYKRN